MRRATRAQAPRDARRGGGARRGCGDKVQRARQRQAHHSQNAAAHAAQGSARQPGSAILLETGMVLQEQRKDCKPCCGVGHGAHVSAAVRRRERCSTRATAPEKPPTEVSVHSDRCHISDAEPRPSPATNCAQAAVA